MKNSELKNIAFEDFISHARHLSGSVLDTTEKGKKFEFNIDTKGFEYIPENGERRHHSFDLIKDYLNPVNIEKKLKTTTYLRALVYLFLEHANGLLKAPCPEGNKNPKKASRSIDYHERDEQVSLWVKDAADGKCESCGNSTVFIDMNDKVFLEVHHIKGLSEGGSDTVANTVAICPNCHREFHYGKMKDEKVEMIYAKVTRLVRE